MKLRKLLPALLLAAGAFSATAQEQNPNANNAFWGKQDVYLHKQTANALNLVNEYINANPAKGGKPSVERKMMMAVMDGILHDTRLDGTPVVSDFMNTRLQTVVDALSKPMPKGTGLQVFKLYNDGFVVRTKDGAVVAFDIYRGPALKGAKNRLAADSLIAAIVDHADIMFLTHNHPDHVDPAVVDMMVKEGKKVVAPDEILADRNDVTHIRSNEITNHSFKLRQGKNINVTILPGHQDQMQNNIYVVKATDGHTYAHTGDQWNEEDLKWLLNSPDKIPAVDVLMLNCWANSLNETANAFKPKLVVTGHENELGHTIDHREAYWRSYDKHAAMPLKTLLLTWGESVNLK